MEQDPKKRIYCYTGTGNCLAAAKQIGGQTGAPIEFITAELADGTHTAELDFCVVVAPSYAYGVPKLVKKFIKKTTWRVAYLAVVITFGSSQRGTAAEAVKLFRKKGQRVGYVAGTQSVENYVHVFGYTDPETQNLRLDKQTENIAAICEALNNRETNGIKLFRPLSAFVSGTFRLFKPLFPKFYRVSPACNGCEICRRVCPPAAITMREKKRKIKTIPRFKATKCDHCQACMQLCPQKAIRYARIKPASPRYLHRDIKLGDLIKRK